MFMAPFFGIGPVLQLLEKPADALNEARLLVFRPSILEHLWSLDVFM